MWSIWNFFQWDLGNETFPRMKWNKWKAKCINFLLSNVWAWVCGQFTAELRCPIPFISGPHAQDSQPPCYGAPAFPPSPAQRGRLATMALALAFRGTSPEALHCWGWTSHFLWKVVQCPRSNHHQPGWTLTKPSHLQSQPFREHAAWVSHPLKDVFVRRV